MARASLIALAAALALAAPGRAAPPAEDTCPTLGSGDPGASAGEDAPARVLREGMALGLGDLLSLRELFPPELWEHREAFFFEGMRLEIGPCHRRYPFPVFFTRATEEHSGKAVLDRNGNLREHVAGLPFPPESIDATAPDAGTRWAWNLELRYRGAGPSGTFRITDFPSRVGSVETYLGSFFWLQTRYRADLAASRYRVPEANENVWVAGGRFEEPFAARHLAWRQMRPASTQTGFRDSDNTYVYVPDMRKPRRAATTWVDGIYLPRYRASQQIPAGGGVPFMEGERISTISPTGSISAGASENIRRGFVGLALRPNAWSWTLVGEKDVLAPLNGTAHGWPDNPERNFGPSGLSVASDRWDVRRAVVVRGVARRVEENVGQVTLYVDWQTQQPLYYVARRADGLLLDVGILVHRFSGDRPEYPSLLGDQPALVFDPVAASFYSTAEGGTGWRRESYDVLSVPPEPADVRRMTSVAELERGR